MIRWIECSLLAAVCCLLLVIIWQQKAILDTMPMSQFTSIGNEPLAQLRAPIVRPLLPAKFIVEVSNGRIDAIPVKIESPSTLDVNVIRDLSK